MAAERNIAGVCVYCIEGDDIYVLIGNENTYIGDRKEYNIVTRGRVCDATAYFSGVVGERSEPGARFAPIKTVNDVGTLFHTIMRMDSAKHGIPKGGLEGSDDTFEDAAIREFNEETSVLLPMRVMRHGIMHHSAKIFFVQVTRVNAEKIIASYRSHFAPIRFGELSNLQLCHIGRLPDTNYITHWAISQLSDIARTSPIEDFEIYSAPCKAMWSSVKLQKIKNPIVNPIINAIINAVADAVINYRSITTFKIICKLRTHLAKIIIREDDKIDIVALFLDFFKLLGDDGQAIVRHYHSNIFESIGKIPKEIQDIIFAEISAPEMLRDGTGGKRTRKNSHRKRQTRRNRKIRKH